MKTLLIVDGAYRAQGETAFLVERLVRGFTEAAPGAAVERVCLKGIRMEYCRGCWSCADADNIGKPIGSCPIEDDVRPLLEKSQACDALVYATPIYEMGPSALMKQFLERNLPVVGGLGLGFRGRSAPRKDKAGAVILASGAPWPINRIFGFTRYPAKLLSLFCRFHGCGKVFVLPAGAVGASEKSRGKWGGKACSLRRRLATHG